MTGISVKKETAYTKFPFISSNSMELIHKKRLGMDKLLLIL